MTAPGSTALQVCPVAGAIGARVTGVRLGPDLSDDMVDCIIRALDEYRVCFFPDQPLIPADLAGFAARLGHAEASGARYTAGRPDVMIRDSRHLKPDHVEDWHSDGSYKPVPPDYTLLHAQAVPDYGGDTLWANMTLAHDLLSPPLQHLLAGLKAVHDSSCGFPSPTTRSATHSLVRADPHGRRSLYYNPLYTRRIDGLAAAESSALLAFLSTHIQQPELTCRHRWAVHDVALWDNRRTIHRPIRDYNRAGGRVLYRITIQAGPR